MKIKQLEAIRGILLCGGIVTTALTKNNVADLEQISSICMASYNLSLLTGFHLEKLTSDYEEIKSIYNLIVNNFVELVEALEIQDDPVKVFALFIYVYRNGYLSNNKDFMYSFNMKDLAFLNGADVVRGRGVCRSISSMFTDVCKELGFTAANVSVKVSSKSLKMKEKLSPVELRAEEESGKLVRAIGKVLYLFPIANHLVTIVNDGKNVGVFDPTNDVYMNMASLGRYEFINNTGATMSYKTISNVGPLLFGQMNTKVNLLDLYKYSKMDQITYEEYKKKYEEVIELIKSNPSIFEIFYDINEYFYSLLGSLCEKQDGMVKRMVPIIPNKKSKK